jgi:hypothetical protein
LESLDQLRRHPATAAEKPRTVIPTFDHPLANVQFPSSTPVDIRPRQLGTASVAWLAGVFGLCYIALPIAAASVGLFTDFWSHVFFNLPGFALATLVTAVGAMVARPKITTDVGATRDPVIAATSGGLLTWAIVHNLSPVLLPFAAMGTAELATFLALNLLEMSLIGMMLASFTRSVAKAFALGMWFQLLVLGLVLGLFAL